MKRGSFSVGVDMDGLHHYLKIHGLGEGGGPEAWTVAMGRFLELFARHQLKATFYCVAEDLERTPESIPWLQRALEAGHEIGNHSWRHPYALTQLSREEMWAEVSEGKRLLEQALACEVLGFRAPGYHTSATLSQAVQACGHLYESSAFPCAPYYLAKATVIGLMRLSGRRSASILGSPRLLCAPRQPYHPDPEQPYRRVRAAHRSGFIHAPISVWSGVPLIGTAFSVLGPKLSGWVARRAASRAYRHEEHLTLEFHAIDLLSLYEDQLDLRLRIQPDLKLHLEHKRRCFDTVLSACQRLEPVRLVDYVQAPPYSS